MRVMVMLMVQTTNRAIEGATPSEALLAALARYNDDLVKAGVMLASEGLRPSVEARRVLLADGTTSVVEGPFPDTAELLLGFWLWQVKSMDEAVEWARRCPDPMPGQQAVLELRRILGAAAFGRPRQP